MTTHLAGSPATEAPGRWQGIRLPVLLGGGVLLASLALHLRDPHQQGSWGFCPWLLLTGTYCPGCGGLRAVNDLTHGDLAAAASSNALFVASVPLLVGLWLRRLVDGWRGVRRQVAERTWLRWATVVLTLTAVFWVVRNLPFATVLTP